MQPLIVFEGVCVFPLGLKEIGLVRSSYFGPLRVVDTGFGKGELNYEAL